MSPGGSDDEKTGIKNCCETIFFLLYSYTFLKNTPLDLFPGAFVDPKVGNRNDIGG